MLVITADSVMNGKSIKELLFSCLGFSNNAVKSLKADPFGILVNGEHVTVRHIISEGEIISLATDDRSGFTSETILPSDIPISVIYENRDYIVVNKPSGMPTHPSHNHHDDSLANALAYEYMKRKEPFVFRAVNRLDLDTSGIVLCAKSRFSAAQLASVRKNGGFIKDYLALVRGRLDFDGEINLPIRRQCSSTMLRETCNISEPGAKYAKTTFRVIAHTDMATLVCAMPVTGRTHQLRVHFAAIGHPILGDGLYGNEYDYERLALHAFRLAFDDPFSHEHVNFFADTSAAKIEIFDKYIYNFSERL